MNANPKVLGLAGYGLTVPDLDVGAKFYGAFGLEATQSAQAVFLRSPGRRHDEIALFPAREKKLHHVSFFIDPAAQDAFREKLAGAKVAVHDNPGIAGAPAGLWFQDPWGMWVHLNPMRPEALPACPQPETNTGTAQRRRGIHLWQEIDRKRPPIRIGHLLMFTDDLERTERFYTDVLGLWATDRALGKATFMAAGEGVVDHHCLAFGRSTHRGLQHSSFHVGSIDDIGFTAWKMREAGYKDGFGPGRHAIASNLFHYTRDPWGSWIECYADMDMVDASWTCRDWQNLPYIWGPEWSPEFWGNDHNANHEPR